MQLGRLQGDSAGRLRLVRAGSRRDSGQVLRGQLDRRGAEVGQARRGVQRQRADLRAPIYPGELHGHATGRSDHRPRAGARDTSISVPRRGLPSAGHAAYDRRNGVGLWRDDRLPPADGQRGRSEGKAVAADGQDRGRLCDGVQADRFYAGSSSLSTKTGAGPASLRRSA